MRNILIVTGIGLGLLFMTGCVAQGDYQNLEAQYNALQTELNSTQAELSSTQAELAELQAKYPPRLFEDSAELEAWLAGQPTPPEATDAVLWYEHARQLQKAAVEDGYIISADYIGPDSDGLYTIWCSAVLQDNSYYYWDPDTDSLYYGMDVKHF
jgi:hypothetical protein